jgi:hypothetical protein
MTVPRNSVVKIAARVRPDVPTHVGGSPARSRLGRIARSALGGALMAVLGTGPATAATYLPGVAPSCATCTFGTHLPEGPAGSLPGVGGSGINGPAGTSLDGARTYIYDQAGWVDGVVARGEADFAMLVWDVGTPLDTVRLYTHQDHYAGGPITTDFVAQDVMEYSVWGSNDNVTFVLLSDVVGYTLDGGGPGLPTYTFSGTEPTVIYRGGSAELGIVNAYTRDYTFPASYAYFGVRTSTISRTFPGGPDADPEIDALAFNRGPISTVPEPATWALVVTGLAGALRRRVRR